tara:strand:- start:5619 stop:7034 length:1416 start_codon:yes stop_codon:yes gene_type:complete
LFNLRQKLFITVFLVISTALIIPGIFYTNQTDREAREEIASSLITHINTFIIYYNSANISPYDAARNFSDASGLRVTLVDSDGLVVGESNVNELEMSKMDNHIDRPEISNAIKDGISKIERYSNTLNEEFIYVVKKVDLPDFSFVRVAQTMDFVNLLVGHRSGTRINIFIIVSIGLLIFTILVDRWINTPIRKVADFAKNIKDGNFENRIKIKSSDEIGELAKNMNQLAETIEADISNMKKMEDVRTEFLSNVTHELKTPIASIVGYLETLKDGALKDKDVNKTFIKRSLKNAKRLEALVTDLVDISRIETGEMEIQLEKVNIQPILEEVVNDARQRNRNLELDIKLSLGDQKEIVVYGNSDRLRQVFDNLVSNAIRYTESGNVIISAEIRDTEVEFTVSDTGMGMDSESIERIFERFFRTDDARKIVRGGTGLGLAICKHIIEAHNSSLSVDSIEKEGSTFAFSLECYEA